MENDIFEHGQVYHVFNRGNNREDIFKAPENYAFFLELMKKYLLQVADVYAYCLLKNHFHLLVRIKDEPDIVSEALRRKPYLGFSHLFNAYTQSVNKAYHRTGSLFQERLKRIRVTNEDYFIQLLAYIHLNPVKHALSKDLSYPYSSYRSILSRQKTHLRREEVLQRFGGVDNFCYWHDLQRIKYASVVELMNDGY